MNTNARVNPFASLDDPPVFTPKSKADKPVPKETIARIAEENNFPSRQAPKLSTPPRRKLRRYRTGRNQHLGIKATAETIERFYKHADERNVPSGELLRLALDALDRGGDGVPEQG
jgi:hypothetical protein